MADPGALGVEALDRYTVRFTLKHPFSEFPDTLGNQAFWVWPVDHLREVGRRAYAAHPVGTGPYRFLKSVPGTSVDLVRNPEWWDTSGGPYIDAIHYQVFNSVTSMMLAFQKGMIDWTLLPVGQVAASRSLPQVKSRLWQVEITPSLALRYLCFNWKDPLVGGTQGLRLRQALAYGCDRRAVIDASSGGVFLPPTTGVVPPGVPGSRDVQGPYPYDPAEGEGADRRHRPRHAEARLSDRPAAAGDRQDPDGELREDRHHHQGEGHRLQHLRALRVRRQGPGVPRRLDRRLPVDGQLPLPAVREQSVAVLGRHVLLEPRGRRPPCPGSRHARGGGAARSATPKPSGSSSRTRPRSP